MSLEEALVANTKALNANTDALLALGELKDVPKHIAREEGSKPAAGKKAAGNTAEGAGTAATTKPAPKGKGKAEITYEQLQPLVMKLAKADRETAVQILADFGVETAKELDPSQFAEAHELFTKALKATGGESDESSLA